MHVERFLLSRRAAGLSPRTVEFYEQQLRYFTESLPPNSTIDKLEASLIENCLAQRQQEVNQRTVHAAWRTIRVFCKWLSTRYPDWENPVPRVTAPKLPRHKPEPVTRDDLQAILSTCKGHGFFTDRDRAILLVLATSGLRAKGFLGLTQGDIDLHTGSVHVQKGKGGAQRMTIISPEARLAVADYLSHLQQRNVKNPRVKSERNLTEAGLFRQGIILPGQAYLL